jgi:RHS repeat-associated protein
VTGSQGTGIYEFMFRKYDPAAGRWLSPDPLGWGSASLDKPQSLNRYTYAMNSPLSNVDPSGLDACAYSNGDGTSTIINSEDGGGVDCPGNGFYITTTQIVTAVGYNGNGDLSIYGAGDGLYNPDGTSYNASQTVTVNGDNSSSYMGPTQFYSPSVQIVIQAPNNGNDMKYDIFHCPSCVNTWKQSNCVVSKPLENAMNSTVKGAVGTAFKAGVSNGAGWSGFLPAAWNAVKTGTVTAGAALWTYANVIHDTARYTVNGCPSE